MRPTIATLVAVLLAAAAPSAWAVSFSTPREMPRHFAEARIAGPPPLAINRRGDAVIAWTGLLGADEVAVGDVAGLRPVNLPGFQGDIHAIAISPTGQALVVYDWLRTVTSDARPAYALVSRGGRAGRSQVLRMRGKVRVAAQPDGSFIAVHGTAGGFVARRIAASGRPGALSRLGRGSLRTFAAAPSGEIIACCRSDGAVWRYGPSRRWSAGRTARAVTSVATAAGRFHTASKGTALVDGSGRTFTLDRPAAAGAFGTGALVVARQNGAWGVALEQNATFTQIATLPADVAHAGIATAGSAAVLAWYDRSHRAFWSFAQP
ncbi:MAG TPA: hypothetical protein VFZ89_10675 [Solirubrobacteraceae bacterium]